MSSLLFFATCVIVGQSTSFDQEELRFRDVAVESIVPTTWVAVRGQYDEHAEPDDDDDNDLALFLLGLGAAAVAVSSPFWLPICLLDNPNSFAFPKYPYHREAVGYLLTNPIPSRHWDGTLRKSFDFATDLEQAQQYHGQLLWEDVSRIGVDGEIAYVRDPALPASDEWWTGDMNLTWLFAYDARAMFRAGLGVIWLHDSDRTVAGPNFTYSGDVFPAQPWVLSVAIDWGLLDGAGVFRGRFTAGVEFHGFEMYAGYEYADFHGLEFGGVVFGLRTWL